MRTLISVAVVLASVTLAGCGWFQPCAYEPPEQGALAPAAIYRVCLPDASQRPRVGVGFSVQVEASYGDQCQANVNVDAGTIGLVVWGTGPSRRTGRCGPFGTDVSAREDAVAPIYSVTCSIPALPAGTYQITDVAPGTIRVPYDSATDGGILDCF